MRLSQTKLSNAATGSKPQGEADTEQLAEEARRAEQIAARRAFLEEKIRNAREAKCKAEEQRRFKELRPAEEARLRTAGAPKPVVEALQASAATSDPVMPPLRQRISAEDLPRPIGRTPF